MYERLNTTVAVFGGNPNVPMQFKGMAGYQVLTWVEFRNEVKTANLQNVRASVPSLAVSRTDCCGSQDPLSPPDL